jgi:hypothetical protein
VEARQVTFKFPSLDGKLQPKQKEQSFDIYMPDPQSRDFITELLKNCSQLYDTEKEYVVSYD